MRDFGGLESPSRSLTLEYRVGVSFAATNSGTSMAIPGRLPPNNLLDTGQWRPITVAGCATSTVDPLPPVTNDRFREMKRIATSTLTDTQLGFERPSFE